MEQSVTKRETIDLSSQGRPFSGGDVWAETWQVRRSQSQVDLEEVPFRQRGQQMHRLWRGKRPGIVRDRRAEEAEAQNKDGRSGLTSGAGPGQVLLGVSTEMAECRKGSGPGVVGRWSEGHDVFTLDITQKVDSPRKCPVRTVEHASSTCQAQC